MELCLPPCSMQPGTAPLRFAGGSLKAGQGSILVRALASSFVIIIIIIIDIFCTIVSDVRFSFQYNHKLNLRQNVNALFQPKMSYIILSACNGHSKEKGVKSSQEGPIPHIHIYFRSNRSASYDC